MASFDKLSFARLVQLMDALEDAGFIKEDVEFFIQNPDVLPRMRRNFVAAERTPVNSLRPMAIENGLIKMLEDAFASSDYSPAETATDNGEHNKLW